MTDHEDEIGSVSEEALKLFAALSDWARETGGEYAGAAASASEAFKSVNEHLATGGEDCTYCPVCRMISAVRATSPEVRAHLTTAATSLFQAAAAAMATAATKADQRQSDGGVERIDLDADWPEDPDSQWD